jgi:HAD superfamily hydrolase (TIGR01484 family)
MSGVPASGDPVSGAPAGFAPKLLALDIDGTLFVPHPDTGFSDDEVSATVREAIDAAVAAGCHVVLASGRSPLSMSTVLRHLDLPRDLHTGGQALVVASNGAVTFTFPPMKVISEVTFDARPAVEAVLQHVPDAMVAVEEHGVGYRVNRHFPDGELDGEIILTPVDDLVAREVSRVIIRDPQSTPEDFVALAERLGLQGTNYFIGWTAWLDLAPEGVSKASGLEEVCARLGVAAEHVLAIGDGRNDIEMLRWAGRGVAMGQAPDEVKAAADDVTLPVEEDGAAAEIRRWF